MLNRSILTCLSRLWCIAFFCVAGISHASTGGSVAFYYGPTPPVNALSQFDRLILEADNVKADEHRELKRNGAATFAYVSVGEVGPHRKWFKQIPASATIGTNTDWNSKVMDLASSDWHRFLLQRINELVSRGYDGLFLDTMDSYRLFAKTPEQIAAQENGLSNLVYRIKRIHPDIRLISNRGFEVIDAVAPYLEAIAAESLYAGWDNAGQSYREVPEADRNWLQTTLSTIKNKHNIDVIAIDYLPPSARSQARDVAARIARAGFIPWVANPALDYVGIGSQEVIARDVLMIYDSRETGEIEYAQVHTLAAMPLEYMGYVPVYHDIAKQPLPSTVLKGQYAGIVMWNGRPLNTDGYPQWLERQFADRTPIAFFSSIGMETNAELNDYMGVSNVTDIDINSLAPQRKNRLIGFESPAPSRIDYLTMPVKSSSADNTAHLTYADKHGVEIDTVITGPWGGIAIHPTVINSKVDETVDWIIDPFTFLKKSLQLTDAPMPDITSENGTRLWFAHIDGDALPSWAELPGRRLGAEVIHEEIVKPYDLPHTISIVEAEMTAIDAYVDRRERMVNIMRKYFAMDNVELASHTFSHPFHWQQLEEGARSGRHNLRLPGYRYSLEREIAGSVQYIDENLAPPGKRTRVFLWSGDAEPPAEALDVVAKYGLLNMNGGNTKINKTLPTVTAISANTRMIGGHIQVYAPIMNENVYTNDWTGPFDGFRNVLETLDMTEFPRRIKPVNIYYHFYIGTKAASLRSLKEVYSWSDKQQLFPVFSSDYIVKVPYFRSAGVSRYLDGRWKISGLGPIRSLRNLKKNAWPDFRSSQSIVGARQIHDGMYIHTNGANSVSFRTQSTKPQQPHLVAANAAVDRWENHRDGRISMRFKGHSPVVIELNGDKRFCNISSKNSTIKGALTPDGNTRYEFTTKDTGDAVINCET